MICWWLWCNLLSQLALSGTAPSFLLDLGLLCVCPFHFPFNSTTGWLFHGIHRNLNKMTRILLAPEPESVCCGGHAVKQVQSFDSIASSSLICWCSWVIERSNDYSQDGMADSTAAMCPWLRWDLSVGIHKFLPRLEATGWLLNT
jgi:hypothetical protein